MKLYIKEIDGVNVVKKIKDIVVEKDNKKIYKPSKKTLLEAGWVEYVKPQLSEEALIQLEKDKLKISIENYDTSNNVNQFSINGVSLWLDKETRGGLELRFKAELAKGRTSTTLWHENMQFPLPLELAIQLLYELEVYASDCYDTTQGHLAEIEKLTTLEEIKNYDYTVGYPEKLNF